MLLSPVVSSTFVVLLALVSVVLFVAVLTAPRWCVRSLHRHRLWRLRDQIADDMIFERLPRGHPAVQDMLERTERSITSYHQYTLLNALVVWRLVKRVSPEARQALDKMGQYPSLAGLASNEAVQVKEYRQALVTLLTGTVLTGSWLGLAAVMVVLPKSVAVVRLDRRQARGGSHGFAVDIGRAATDKAVSGTFIGKKTQQTIRDVRAGSLVPVP